MTTVCAMSRPAESCGPLAVRQTPGVIVSGRALESRTTVVDRVTVNRWATLVPVTV